MKNKEIVILVHGFNKDRSDMLTLDRYLTSKGYSCLTVNLPTRYGTIDECSSILKKVLIKLTFKDGYKRIDLVGHSMGGLIIMETLTKVSIPNLGRCVFIATPMKGTKLADLAEKYFPPLIYIFKSLGDLRTSRIASHPSDNKNAPQIGVIAGSRCNLLLGKLLKQKNDGRVEIDSTKTEIMKDYIELPYGHKEIHHKQDVAELVYKFLTIGKFDSGITNFYGEIKRE